MRLSFSILCCLMAACQSTRTDQLLSNGHPLALIHISGDILHHWPSAMQTDLEPNFIEWTQYIVVPGLTTEVEEAMIVRTLSSPGPSANPTASHSQRSEICAGVRVHYQEGRAGLFASFLDPPYWVRGTAPLVRELAHARNRDMRYRLIKLRLPREVRKFIADSTQEPGMYITPGLLANSFQSASVPGLQYLTTGTPRKSHHPAAPQWIMGVLRPGPTPGVSIRHDCLYEDVSLATRVADSLVSRPGPNLWVARQERVVSLVFQSMDLEKDFELSSEIAKLTWPSQSTGESSIPSSLSLMAGHIANHLPSQDRLRPVTVLDPHAVTVDYPAKSEIVLSALRFALQSEGIALDPARDLFDMEGRPLSIQWEPSPNGEVRVSIVGDQEVSRRLHAKAAIRLEQLHHARRVSQWLFRQMED